MKCGVHSQICSQSIQLNCGVEGDQSNHESIKIIVIIIDTVTLNVSSNSIDKKTVVLE